MKTVCLQIGNGDDKLSQSRWHDFVVQMKALIDRRCTEFHFFGGPETWSNQQNVAFVFNIPDASIGELKAEVIHLRKQYFQESVAWTEGETQFL